MRKHLNTAMLDVMLFLAGKLAGTGYYELLGQDELTARLFRMAQRCERLGRMNELQRIKESTLDAESDVWSKTDDGQIVSLTQRLADLEAEWDRRPAKPVQSASASPLEYSGPTQVEAKVEAVER